MNSVNKKSLNIKPTKIKPSYQNPSSSDPPTAQSSYLSPAFYPQPNQPIICKPNYISDLDSRNETSLKSSSHPIPLQERKPLSNLQPNTPSQQTVNKNKNHHTKINRGISPNQPPVNKSRTQTISNVENRQ